MPEAILLISGPLAFTEEGDLDWESIFEQAEVRNETSD